MLARSSQPHKAVHSPLSTGSAPFVSNLRQAQRRSRTAVAQAGVVVKNVNTATFSDEVLKATVPVVVDFWADWCGPCKLISPLMTKLQEAAGDRIKVVKVECDGNPDLVDKYGVYGLPTLVVFRDGEMVEGSKREGAIGMPGILAWLASNDVAVEAKV